MPFLNPFSKQKRVSDDITPDDIFLDASNLPALAVEQFEGRIEQPVQTRAVWMIGAVFAMVVLTFGWQLFDLQIVKGSQYALTAEENRLTHSLLFAERGVIYDRTGRELAWNERTENLPYALRHYNNDLQGLAHVVGYVRYPRTDTAGIWWRTELAGVSGSEYIFDGTLSGVNGTEMAEVDVHGAVHRRSLIEKPQQGKSITLSINAELQSVLHNKLKNHAAQNRFQGGSGVIMDVLTGEIIALTNIPEYDPDVLTNGSDAIAVYHTDPRKPFLNRATSGVYTPGSIVKPILAAGALAEGIIDTQKQIFSPGYITVPNPYNPDKPSIIKDWRVNGWTAMREALAVSSDVFFFSIGGGYEDQEGLGIARIDRYARVFGLGKTTGFDFVGEAEGVIPTPEWKEEVFNGDPWRLGDTYNTSIGQYGFQVTPMQMVRMTSAIANGGALPTPHILASTTPVMTPVGISDDHLKVIREGMRMAVTSELGTAKALSISGFPIAAKTGTAQVGAKNEYMNSWVIGFWPYEKPRYAFAVVLERAPAGTPSGAAPAMRGFFEWLKDK